MGSAEQETKDNDDEYLIEANIEDQEPRAIGRRNRSSFTFDEVSESKKMFGSRPPSKTLNMIHSEHRPFL